MESLSNGVEMPRIASTIDKLIKRDIPQDSLTLKLKDNYKDYYPEVDQATMVAMLEVYKKSVDADALPELYTEIQKKFKGDFAKYARFVYEKSDFTSIEKITKAIEHKKTDFSKDPAVLFALEVKKTIETIRGAYVSGCQLYYAPDVWESGRL